MQSESKDYCPDQEALGNLVVPTARVQPTNLRRPPQLHYQLNMDEARDPYDRVRYPHPAVRRNDRQFGTSVSPNWDPTAINGPFQTCYVSPPMSDIIRSRSNPHLNIDGQGSLRHYPSVPSHLNYINSQERGYVPPSHYQNPSYNLAPVLEHHCPYSGSPEFLTSYERVQRELPNTLESRHSPLENVDKMMYQLQLKDKEHQIQELERQHVMKNEYLRNLPTQEELEKLQRQCANFERDKEQCMVKIKQLKRSLEKAKEEIISKGMRIETLEQRNATFRIKLETAKQGLQSLNLDREITSERDILLTELKLIKKEFELKDQALQTLQGKYDQEMLNFKEKIENEKNFQTTLRKEILYKEDSISMLKTRLREADAKKEQLLEENLSLQEQAKVYQTDICHAEERYVLEKKLLRELRNGVSELKGLTEIVDDLTKGNDPNLSTILGPSVNFSLEPKKELINEKSISRDIEEAIEIKSKLCEVREKISESYAEYLGDKLWCTTQ